MSGNNVNFWNKKIKKSKFYKNKKVTKVDDTDVNKILISKEEPYGTKNSFKYFIGYIDNDAIRPLCIKLSQMTGFVRKHDDNTMSFKISNKQLLKNYNQIWKKVKRLLNIQFDREPVYGDNSKYIKTKIETYDSSVITYFQGKNMPKEKAPCKSIIMVDSVAKGKRKHYPQTFLEECKYEAKKIKMENLVDDDLEKRLSDESENEPNNDSDDEKDNDESNESFVSNNESNE